MIPIGNLKYKVTHIPVKKLDPRARIPSIAHEGDVGFDLYPLETTTLVAGAITVVKTGLAFTDFPSLIVENGKVISVSYPKIESRSGLASKGVFVIGGIVDPSYRGEIMVLLCNTGTADMTIESSKACAQFVIYLTMSHIDKHNIVRFIEDDNEPTKTDRNTSGFGSSDVPNL